MGFFQLEKINVTQFQVQMTFCLIFLSRILRLYYLIWLFLEIKNWNFLVYRSSLKISPCLLVFALAPAPQNMKPKKEAVCSSVMNVMWYIERLSLWMISWNKFYAHIWKHHYWSLWISSGKEMYVILYESSKSSCQCESYE